MANRDELLTKKAELTAKAGDFQTRVATRSTPEGKIRAQIQKTELELRKANREFAASYSSGTIEALEAAKGRALAAEESIKDLNRILEGGVLRDEEAQKLFTLGTALHEEAFHLGKEMQGSHPDQLSKVLELRTAYVESIRQLGNFTREICAVAAMLDQTRQWADRYHDPMTIKPNSIENFIQKLIVDDVEIRQAHGLDGQWLVQR
jgi:hypothetical protein